MLVSYFTKFHVISSSTVAHWVLEDCIGHQGRTLERPQTALGPNTWLLCSYLWIFWNLMNLFALKVLCFCVTKLKTLGETPFPVAKSGQCNWNNYCSIVSVQGYSQEGMWVSEPPRAHILNISMKKYFVIAHFWLCPCTCTWVLYLYMSLCKCSYKT